MCALALHLAFPRTDWPWIAPLAFAGLFACWFGLGIRAAALSGYLAGIAFFWTDFAWFGETAGRLVGPFAPLLSLGPALLEGVAFAATAVLAAIVWRRAGPGRAALTAAAAFAATEWLRSSGEFGVPFGTIGVAMVATPLKAIAAFGGGTAVTFAVAWIGAAGATLLLARGRAVWPALSALAVIVVVTLACWWNWPARVVATPGERVAAVQGNIVQTLKWTPEGRAQALARYVPMTAALRAARVQFVLWPETVIPANLVDEPALRASFAALADRAGAEVAVGAHGRDASGREANVVFFFAPRRGLVGTYTKAQLVPFAEYLPGPAALRSLPFANEAGDYAHRNGQPLIAQVVDGVGPLICWESLFSDIGVVQARDARFLAITTDDAWFGTTAGPYEHAQAASLRAIETGRWVLRAGATGISGIVAPDGTWRERSALETQTVVIGDIGAPQPPPFAGYGPVPVGIAFTLIALLAFLPAPAWRRSV